MNNTINPYELLGFDSKNPNHISLNQLKKTYYNLSLICHPDKGGSIDTMIVLKNCYEYIKNQLENAKEHSTDFETIENEFKSFLQNQSSKPPPFSAIYSETHDGKDWNTSFNEKFEKEKEKEKENQTDVFTDYNNKEIQLTFLKLHANTLTKEISDLFKLNSDGYGNMMDKEDRDSETDINLIKEPTHHFSKDITIYTEPISYNSYTGKTFSGKIDNNTHMTDYIEAFAEDIKSDESKVFKEPIETNNNNSDIEDKLQKLLKERNEIDNIAPVSSIFLLSKSKLEIKAEKLYNEIKKQEEFIEQSINKNK
jgi:curved DNA-binding protein CbpA